MKNNLLSSSLIKIFVLVASFMLVLLYNQSKAAVGPAAPNTMMRVAINFKNDIEKNELTVKVKSNREANMQLFFFSPDGILIKEVAVSPNKLTTIKGLKRGFYLYECFENDERMKSGSLIIK